VVSLDYGLKYYLLNLKKWYHQFNQKLQVLHQSFILGWQILLLVQLDHLKRHQHQLLLERLGQL
jgi:hypothetical protein